MLQQNLKLFLNSSDRWSIIVKKCAALISPFIAKLFHKSLADGVFTEAFKNTTVKPLYSRRLTLGRIGWEELSAGFTSSIYAVFIWPISSVRKNSRRHAALATRDVDRHHGPRTRAASHLLVQPCFKRAVGRFTRSMSVPFQCGVPQGSVLYPCAYRFILYTAQLENVVKANVCNLSSYADYSQLYVHFLHNDAATAPGLLKAICPRD